MLDNSENQRLHERIAEVAALFPGLGAPTTSASLGGAADCPPFSKQKLDRILERVYDRLCHDAGELDDPQLRQLLADTLARQETATTGFPEAKTLRILARVEARLAADISAAPKPAAEADKQRSHRASALAKLRSAASALLLLRHLSFDARLLSDPRGPRPLTDGPTE
jgi:hypothetical protein